MTEPFSYKRCPLCGEKNTFQRHGMHFDHERYCGDCRRAYDPEEGFEKWLTDERHRLDFNTHKE